MAGPLATIYDIYKNEQMSKKIAAPIWVVFISAFSLVVGLATYGYHMYVPIASFVFVRKLSIYGSIRQPISQWRRHSIPPTTTKHTLTPPTNTHPHMYT